MQFCNFLIIPGIVTAAVREAHLGERMEVCEADSTTVGGSGSATEVTRMKAEVLDSAEDLEPGFQARRRISVEDAAESRRLREEERRHGLNWEVVAVPLSKEDPMMGEFEAGRACLKCEEPGDYQDQAN